MASITLRLFLVRHGSTDTTDAGRFLGWRDESLNANGLRQAEELRAATETMDFDSMWTSDLRRAVETAEVIREGFRQDDRLREIGLGELEGKSWDECSPEVQGALLDFEGFTAPRGESTGQVRARVHEFLGELEEGDHLIVTHGGVIRMLLRQVEDDRTVAPGEMMVVDWTNRILSAPTMDEANLLRQEQRQPSLEAED